MLGGFSQGCVMALALGLGAGRPRPAAIAGFSRLHPAVEGWELDLERPLPPVALGHGTLDPVIPVEFGRAPATRCSRRAPSLLYREYPLAHTLDPRFLRRGARLARPAGLVDEPLFAQLGERRVGLAELQLHAAAAPPPPS